MPYLNMDDKFPKHPKVIALSDAAYRLHTSGMFYCAEFLTDGLIGDPMVKNLVGYSRSALNELTRLDADGKALWLRDPRVAGWQVHDYLEWNKPRSWWLDKRKRDAERQAAWREKHGKQGKPGEKG